MVRQQKIFVCFYDDRIHSEVVFMLKQKMYLMDDHIFEEGDKEDLFNDNFDNEQESL